MNVGDYVRTKDGVIAKIIKCNSIYFILDIDKDNIAHEQDEIIKSSPNIIDLIKVGDYISGLPVRFVEENRIDIGQAEDYLWLKNEHIKSIVTKEQFESMEYKIGE